MKTGSVHGLTQSKFRAYLMGYVAGIVYHDGSEWLLTKAGHWASNRHDAQPDQQSHVWPTRAQAEAVARKANGEFKAFTRGYVYSTPNPENARGLIPTDDAQDTGRAFIRSATLAAI